ncbi:MAG: YkgJ family cysteine cluster protein [Synergistaceae bacterium]|jgi:Fe-S-cluster containining protein|nr:YkgJ family cysteine cluster protein [Synergistaceae bacterium]
MAEENLPEPWWSEGLRFTCLGCGRCCRGEPGAIFFTPEEGEKVRGFLNLDRERFNAGYVTHRWGRPSFVERFNGDCVFLDSKSAKCAIYPLRPLQCSLFPFWPSVVESKAEWDRQARHCPGMNDGRLWSPEEIRELLRRSPFGDL